MTSISGRHARPVLQRKTRGSLGMSRFDLARSRSTVGVNSDSAPSNHLLCSASRRMAVAPRMSPNSGSVCCVAASVYVPGGTTQDLVARCSTGCYSCPVSGYPEITQRDLRMRSREIMDAIEHGQSFTVTRDGHRIGELIPLRQRRRYVSRPDFVAMSRNAPAVDLDAFRADQDAALDSDVRSRYDR